MKNKSESKVQTEWPKKIFDISTSPNTDGRFSNDTGSWSVARLIELSKDEPVYEVPTFIFNTWQWPWEDNLSLSKFLCHVKRVNDADLSYPILINADGGIIDGVHRLCKACVLGIPTIKVKYITLPAPDGKVD